MLLKANINEPVTSPKVAKQYLKELVHKIGMNPVTKPQAYYVQDAGNEGLTASINLATSHIAFHCWDYSKLLMLDVYSCKEFNPKDVLSVTAHYFYGFEDYQYQLMDRYTFLLKHTLIEMKDRL